MSRRLTHRLRDGLIDAGARAGLSIVPTWRLDRLPMAKHLRRLFAHLRVDLVLDVGANLGQYRDFLRDEVGYAGRIVSYEPIPDHAAAMRQRAESDPLWTVEAKALGRAPGTATFNVMAGSQFSSFLTPEHNEVSLFREQNAVSHAIDVPVSTVALELEAIDRGAPAVRPYLKLDTQGFDLAVLDGAGSALERIVALQSEASVRKIYTDAPDYVTTLQTIERRGFALSGIFPNNDGHFPQLVEFDCVFVSRRELAH
ncbi:MAG: FkbM family methyltransferase [Gemmatimonadaceae bacterium]|jgi:FkbM family methyltransferase|nr:FkbM family methyltransferase [Gemmatimonadaceae bacterium]